MKEKERIKEVLYLLDENYGDEPVCYLNYKKDYELLIGTILAAQCTDDRVNIVTKTLFKKYNTLKKFADADLLELEQDVKPTGFYRHKAAHIIGSSIEILEKHNGIVPREMEKLTALPGVGRKTANVIRTHIYKEPSIVVDTHVKRVSYKLGFTKYTDPTKIEFDLMKKLPKGHWARYNSQIMALGRTYCRAIKTNCSECYLRDLCKRIALPKKSATKK